MVYAQSQLDGASVFQKRWLLKPTASLLEGITIVAEIEAKPG